MSGHARYAPSSADRWLNCPGSIRLSERAPPQVDSVYSLDGTQAHRCLEDFLLAGESESGATKRLLLKSNPLAMVNFTLDAAKVIWADAAGETVLSEAKVRLPGVDDIYGTLDAAVHHEMLGLLRIYDYKHGAGVPVDVAENLQLICYGLAKASELDGVEEVELVILQPRAEHVDGPVRRWRLPLPKLQTYLKRFHDGRNACEAQLPGKEDLSPGKWCRFCPAKPICPAIGERAMADAQVSFTRLDNVPAVVPEKLPAPSELKDLGRALEAAEKLDTWVSAVREYAYSRLLNGDVIPGFKLVQKQARRKWVDEKSVEDEAKTAFGDLAFDTVLLSPAQLEKQLGAKAWVAERTTSESSGLTVAPEKDKRPAVCSGHTFGVLE